MAITMNWPHSYAVIFQNPQQTPLNIPWLGRHGITFKPGEKVAIVGNPLVVTERLNQYNGKKTIRDLSVLVENGQLEVLSIPGGTNEKTNTTVPFVDGNGHELPGCKIIY